MNEDFLVMEVDCHNDAPEDYAEIRWMKLPEASYLAYALPDKPNEIFSAEEFKMLAEKKIRFKRSPELVIIVINKNTGKRRAVPFLLEWPNDMKPGVTSNRFNTHITVP